MFETWKIRVSSSLEVTVKLQAHDVPGTPEGALPSMAIAIEKQSIPWSRHK